MTRFFALLTCALVIACSSTPQPEPDDPDVKALVRDPAVNPKLGRHVKGEWSLMTKAPPASKTQIKACIDKGVEFLLKSQNRDGSWGTAAGTATTLLYSPMPGSKYCLETASTCLCITALLDIAPNDPRVKKAINRAEGWIDKGLGRTKRITRDVLYNIWSHGYAIEALVRLKAWHPKDSPLQQKYSDHIHEQIRLLKNQSTVMGGWGYYDFEAQAKQPTGFSPSFATAAILVALDDARDIGIDTMKKSYVDKALLSLRKQRNPDGTFQYGHYFWMAPHAGINRTPGSLGRNQVCHLALYLYEDPKTKIETMEHWLHLLVKKNVWLSAGRKMPIPHEKWYQVSGYFYYYGHYYAGLAMRQVTDKVAREVAPELGAILIRQQEKEGSWWDYAFYDYHRFWGTPMALVCLNSCYQALDK